jgi:tripartite-type tricarboxylate transporter receptor subunit TctC
MRVMIRLARAAVAATACVLAGGAQGQTQAWPTRPVTLVVPFAPGVSSDVMARGMAEYLGRELGQNVIVENKGGAGGNIGAASVARSTPDGYTFLFATTGQAATNKLMYKRLNYDSDKDLSPIILLGKLPVIVAAKKDGRFKTMKDMVDYAKANPGKLSVAFPGNGTLGHITGLLFAKTAGISMNAVQYTGTGQIITDVVGGHVDAAMDSAGGYVGAVQGGQMVALALASSGRFPPMPDAPTVSEAALPGFEASVWYALLAPAGTPADIVAKLNAAVNKYLKSDTGKGQFDKLGVVISGGTPEELKAFIAAEQAKWGPVIAENKIEF